ncbi:SpoIIE family protein phosphatase [Paracrocinitomix mangrovi]|uniref:SpoIIE family protein phosphatase n=1 Tax=Paracrocinitomix mangrovi TaxID=2862509 RepID=UPI001C8EFC3E|nr:SpoIIE family protein phosphatase [Paracrocinitomix mangrovi]UKN01294.1 SpoIIE family protein phosphatase [Paracrocinitomix mangrovi]
MHIRSIFLFIFIAISTVIYGQKTIKLGHPKKIKLESPYKGTPFRYFTYHYNINSNLHSNNVDDIAIDSEGRVWMASQNSGIAVMDGIDLYTFGKHNGLWDRYSDVFVDHGGTVWAGGNGVGAVKFLPNLYAELYIDYSAISDLHIQQIAEDSKNNIWISTRLGGITCIKEDTTLFFNEENHGGHTEIHVMSIDANDVVWYVANKKLYYIKDNVVNEMHYEEFVSDPIMILSESNKNYPPVGLFGDTFYEISTEKLTKINFEIPDGIEVDINSLKYDNNGLLYFASFNSVHRIEDGVDIPIISNQTHLGIRDFEFDKHNSLWISTIRDGVYFIPDQNILRLTEFYFRKQNHKRVVLLTDDKDYVGAEMKEKKVLANKKTLFNIGDSRLGASTVTEDGFYFEDRKGNRHYFDTLWNSIPSKASFYKDYSAILYHDLQFLISKKDKKGYVGDDKSKTHILDNVKYIKPFHKENDRYYVLVEEKSWEKYGIGYFENGTYTSVFDSITVCDYKDSIPIQGLNVTAASYVNDTTFWVTTWGTAMYVITPNTCQSVSEGFGSSIIWGYDIDPEGNLWIGGIEGGLNYVDKKTTFVFNINDKSGLLGPAARSIYCDKDGSVLVGTNVGMAYFEPKVKDLPVNSKDDFFKKYKFKFYSPKQGLIGDGFSALFKDEYNRLWATSRTDVLHIIDIEGKEFQPEHLHFEQIYTLDSDNKISHQYFWIPGSKPTDPKELVVDYGEILHIKTKAAYFTNSFGLNYQWQLDSEGWSLPQTSNDFVLSGLPNGKHVLKFRTINEKLLSSNEIELSIIVNPPFYQKAWFIILMILIGAGLIYLLFRWRIHVLKERQKQLEDTVEERTEEIRIQKIEIETQHEEIKDSITYAKRIQEAILPPTSLVNKCLPDSFILYKPKDVVAGDFYWLEEIDDYIMFAAADCTGHGVPGAMVSVVCHNALSRSVKEFGLRTPGDILDKTRDLVIDRFETGKQEVNDGMDIGLCVFNKKTRKLYFSGANNGIYLIRNNELYETKGDNQPIGKFHRQTPFNTHEIELIKNDIFYLYTDGFADQFGGEKGKKLKSSFFKKLLIEKHQKAFKDQYKDLDNAFEEWKGNYEQVDDVCVIGVSLSAYFAK